MYLFVFQYSPYIENEDNVFLIYPNEIETDNFIPKSEGRTIPSKDFTDKYSFVAELPKGKELVAEAVMAVALKKVSQFPRFMTVDEFHSLLSKIPLGQRRESMISYEIIQGGNGNQITKD